MEENNCGIYIASFDRKPNPETNLEYLVRVMSSVKELCHECYGEKIDMSSDKFVEMMVVDDCFIVELFRKHTVDVPTDENDPVFLCVMDAVTKENDDPEDYELYVLGEFHHVIVENMFLLDKQLSWGVPNFLFGETKENDKPEDYDLLQLAPKLFQPSLLYSNKLHG
ncbi:hypothetical protein ACFX2I_026508 [Malus domestica]|uniref:Uncharacterized protein n=1 Tax=Malus domestica TaxID=3750 RepID=A0A498KEP7_MALDO|nr:hypothetical protein DVH24_018130 [Malus domestica]